MGRTIAFFPEGAYGPTNNCVGIGNVLRERGHRVVFIIEESFAGTLEAQGFEERLMRLGPPPEEEEAPGQFWKDFVAENAPVFQTPTIEQLTGFIEPTFRALYDGAVYVDDRLTEIIEEIDADAIVEDNVIAFPALPASGRPWVRIVSCNPTEMVDPDLPPVFSGLPQADRSGWPEFWAEYDRVLTPLHGEFSEFCQSRGASPLPARAFIHESPHLNFYAYPSEADYRRSAGLGPLWHNLDSTIRSGDEDWASPPEIAEGEGSLVYLSLGSLGSADTALMQGLIDTLDASPHRVIVSMGPLHDQLELGERMVGAEFLPQPSVLPHVDLVITHGGNNTVVESLHFGKPMIVLPLFWDQHDNAQRIDETGFGVRLDTYRHEPDELTGAIDTLIGDQALRERLARVSARLQGRGGVTEAAGLIEQAAATRS
ncbi:MAG: glycosyltransferase family 1 protein [Solirubrobacterales bacterium]|nr:glycosyltransferase family 1 protein [Solirubrobacterales bacterium]